MLLDVRVSARCTKGVPRDLIKDDAANIGVPRWLAPGLGHGANVLYVRILAIIVRQQAGFALGAAVAAGPQRHPIRRHNRGASGRGARARKLWRLPGDLPGDHRERMI
jgi:hypothetical protein